MKWPFLIFIFRGIFCIWNCNSHPNPTGLLCRRNMRSAGIMRLRLSQMLHAQMLVKIGAGSHTGVGKKAGRGKNGAGSAEEGGHGAGWRADRDQEGGRFGGNGACRVLTAFPGLIHLYKSMWTCASNITGVSWPMVAIRAYPEELSTCHKNRADTMLVLLNRCAGTYVPGLGCQTQSCQVDKVLVRQSNTLYMANSYHLCGSCSVPE